MVNWQRSLNGLLVPEPLPQMLKARSRHLRYNQLRQTAEGFSRNCFLISSLFHLEFHWLRNNCISFRLWLIHGDVVSGDWHPSTGASAEESASRPSFVSEIVSGLHHVKFEINFKSFSCFSAVISWLHLLLYFMYLFYIFLYFPFADFLSPIIQPATLQITGGGQEE